MRDAHQSWLLWSSLQVPKNCKLWPTEGSSVTYFMCHWPLKYFNSPTAEFLVCCSECEIPPEVLCPTRNEVTITKCHWSKCWKALTWVESGFCPATLHQRLVSSHLISTEHHFSFPLLLTTEWSSLLKLIWKMYTSKLFQIWQQDEIWIRMYCLNAIHNKKKWHLWSGYKLARLISEAKMSCIAFKIQRLAKHKQIRGSSLSEAFCFQMEFKCSI